MIKTRKGVSRDGEPTYSISGLTYAQIFRIKHAMLHEAERLQKIIDEDLKLCDDMKVMFRGYVEDCELVAGAASEVC